VLKAAAVALGLCGRLWAQTAVTEINRNATYEVRHKEALDWPLATASVALRMKGTTVESARVVMGHVAPIPWQPREAEQFLSRQRRHRRRGRAGGQSGGSARLSSGARGG
jgi:xanthine dehydrogenase iron-sulfur cluster and FAD-binding subunit A